MTEVSVNGNGFHHGTGDEDARVMDELLQNPEFRGELQGLVLEQLQRSAASGSDTITNGPTNNHAPRLITPISDIRGVDTLNYRKGEKVLRCKLASCYRLLDSATEDTHAYISARNGPDQLLIAPEGLLHGEVTASSLVTVHSSSCCVLDEGSTCLDVNDEEVLLHSAIYSARQNINCVLHITSHSAVAVSVMKTGLLPLCYEAMVLGEITYYDYSGSIERNDIDSIRRTLGDNSQVLFLRSFGVVVVGETIEETYKVASNVLTATESQVNLIPLGIENLYLPSREVVDAAYHTERDTSAGVDYGEVEFEGLMRKLDYQGYCTGYIYQDSAPVQRAASVTNTAQTGRMSSLDERTSGIATPLNQLLMRGRRPERVVSPNVYWREESDVVDSSKTGSLKGRPKKLYRWVSSEAISNKQKACSASMKNLCPNKFAPQGSNPNELRDKVKEIRKEYFDDKITAGPQSTVLEGVTWDEAQRIKEGQLKMNGVSNVRVTAASRGVIQREHQRDALFYKNYTLNNPFEHITDEELEKYKKDVMKKSKKGYGKYAESEPEFLSERYPMSPVRATTPPAKPARMYPVENEFQSYTRSTLQSSDVDEPEIRAGTNKPVLATQPQPRANLSVPNKADAEYHTALLDVPSDRSATLDSRSSKENSPYGSLTKKKKRGFRLPSFSKKKDK